MPPKQKARSLISLLAVQALSDLAKPVAGRQMAPWEIVFSGPQGLHVPAPLGAEIAALPPAAEIDPASDIGRVVFARHCAPPIEIRSWLESQGLEITDSGAGSRGWHLTVPCTWAQAEMVARWVAGPGFDAHRDIGISAGLYFCGWDGLLAGVVVVCPHVWSEVEERLLADHVTEVCRDEGENTGQMVCAADHDEPDGFAIHYECLRDQAPDLAQLLASLQPGQVARRSSARGPWTIGMADEPGGDA